MPFCKQCSATVRVTMMSCYRCGRPWPGISRRGLRRNLIRGAILLAVGLAGLAFAAG